MAELVLRYTQDPDVPFPEVPEPLNVVTRVGPLRAQMLTGDEPTILVGYETREAMPIYLRHPFAVYEISEGQFSVTRNGEWWGTPFETTDAELARMVCDQWAEEFSPAHPATPPPAPTPPAKRERVLLFWSAFFVVWMGADVALGLAITGELGGTGHDPLWVGPVCAGASLVVACLAAVAWTFCEVILEERDHREAVKTER